MVIFFVIVLLLILILGLFFRKNIIRLLHVNSLFDKKNIIHNFMHMEEIFPTTNVPRSSSPTRLPVNISHTLPKEFMHKGKTYNVEEFLKDSTTTGLLIIHKGVIVFEKYYNGLTPETTHISWSVAKSFISGLFGIALEEGKIESIEDPITKYLPQFKGTGYDGVRIKDALQMSSGVRFDEDYTNFNSDINRFGRYFALGQSFEKFALSLKNERPPGTYNHYVSIDTQVLGMILKKVTGQTLTDYLKEKIWDPMGMEHDAQWVVDGDHMEMVLGGLNATLRDYAKFGQLFLQKGNWFGKQIVPKKWIEQSIEMDAPHLQPGNHGLSSNTTGYGFQWWIPQDADGAFLARGIYSQNIYIVPNRDLVITKLSANYRFKDDTDLAGEEHIAFLKSIASQFPRMDDNDLIA